MINQFSLPAKLLQAMTPVVIWVGPRTDNLCEPRQVRKEAAAAKYCRVANQSSSGGIFFLTFGSDEAFDFITF